MKKVPGQAGDAIPGFLKGWRIACAAVVLAFAPVSIAQSALEHHSDGDGHVTISGELRQWHTVTLDLAGPFAREADSSPNPFTDYRLTVTFEHESGSPRYVVPGYFAADGNAGQTGAASGTVWRAHLSPDKPGRWNYRVSFVRGPGVATSDSPGRRIAPFDGRTGSFDVKPTNKTGRDFRAKGRLEYVGGHYLRFAGTGEYFLKAGPDAPETFLACSDFDGTVAHKASVPLKTWAPHVRDWHKGDPTWRDARGKGIIGALNYLASKGLDSFSFLTYNAGGDGDDVWPFVKRDDKLHYDCSKLDQWEIVFAHAQQLGLYLHFKLQETENDDQRWGHERKAVSVPEALDGGALGPERKLYLRELIARFGHHLALNWNLGEENTQTTEEQRAMAQYIADTDPCTHHIVIHTYPNEQERVYDPLLGDQSALTGASLQNMWNVVHERTWHWVTASERAGKPWVVANDEQGSAGFGTPPDPGYEGFNGTAGKGKDAYDLNDIRRYTLWGNLMAGGAGVEFYFGYKLPQNDLLAEDYRSRDRTWDYCRIALEFFAREKIPFWKMHNADELVGNPKRDNSCYCFVQPGELYLVYLPHGGTAVLDLSSAPGKFALHWFDPRKGGALQPAGEVSGGAKVALQAPSDGDDWLAVVRAMPLRTSAASPAGNPIRIMPVGDSITAGEHYGFPALEERTGYRKALYEMLTGAGYRVDFVGSQKHGIRPQTALDWYDWNCEAYPGWTIPRIAEKVGAAMTACDPDILLVHVGTNGKDWEDKPGQVASLLDRVNAYALSCNHSVTVLLCQIINRFAAEDPVPTTRFNQEVARMVKARSGDRIRIVLVDMEHGAGLDYSDRLPDPDATPPDEGGDMLGTRYPGVPLDRYHPNDKGNAKIARKFYQELVELLGESPGRRPGTGPGGL